MKLPQKINVFLQSCLIQQQKPQPVELRFEKVIYQYDSKTQEQIFDILKVETVWLLKENEGFRVKRYSEPIKQKDGSRLYFIYLEPTESE